MELFRTEIQTIKSQSKHIKMTVLLMFLLHGMKLSAVTVGIDTEALIYDKEGLYQGWLNTGRQGLVLLKYLFKNVSFNPYFSAVMTLLVFPIAVSAYFLLWSSVFEKRGSLTAWFIGGLLWMSHPILTEQFYFSLQSFEIALGFLLLAAASYLTLSWTKNRRRLWSFGAAVIFLLLIFSIYQAFVPLYIFAAVSVLFFQSLRELSERKQKTAASAMARIGCWSLVFIIAFLINTVITQKFFSVSDYLAEQVNWGTASVLEILWHICGHIVFVMLGRGTGFYSPFYGCLQVCSLVLFAVYLYRNGRKNKSGCAITFFLYLALQSSPFLMTFVQGGEPVLRSQLILPAMTGLQAMFCLWMAQELDVSAKASNRVVLYAVILIGLLGGVRTAKITWRLYYTDQLRYEQDVALGRDLIQRLEEIGDQGTDSLPVVFVGTRPFQGNHSCLQGQVMGQSFFDWDASAVPVPYWSTRRVVGFLHVLGADYDIASTDRLEDAIEYSQNMPKWPAEDCVQVYDGMVIVKLSEPD